MDAEAFYGDVFDKYARHMNPSLAKLMGFAGFGVEVWAEGCILRDHEGREFIDCLGGYGTFTFGHRHTEIVQAVKDQLDHLALSGKAFFSANAANLAAQLAEIAPGDLQYAFFSNSGTEAVEAALKMAKAVTRRSKIVSTEGSYHGKTIGALSTTGREKYRKRFEPLMPGVEFVPYGDSQAAASQIDSNTAAMIVEPIQGEGGIILPPDGYLASLRESCDRHGALLIFDEVQSGLGRAGSLFACNHEGIAPDLMTLAKALGGGIMPIGATLGTPAIFESMFSENPLAHTSTFGGNPLACAAAIKALEILQRDDYAEKSRVRGAQMKHGFEQIQARYPEIVAEVRGRGLMIGFEFAMDEVGELVVAQLLKRGVCVAYALNNPLVLRFEPPLVITEEQVSTVIIAVEESLAETAELLAMIA